MRVENSDSFYIGAIPFNQFEKSCGGFEIVSALRFVQRVTAERSNQTFREINLDNSAFGPGSVTISAEANAFIAKHLLLNSSPFFHRSFNEPDYIKAVVYSNHLETDLNYIDASDPDGQRWLIRSLYAQGRYQRIPAHLLGRYYILFNELGDKSTSISKMFHEANELKPSEIMLIGSSFYGTIVQNKHLDITNIERHTIPPLNDILKPEKMAKFLRSTSISQDKFRVECKRWNLDNNLLKKYEFNPLWLYPIIQTEVLERKSHYIVPSLNDLVYRCTEGIYFSTMDYYRQSGRENPFSTEFGELFGHYVGYLLQDVKKQNQKLGSIEPETEYQFQGNRIKSADWLLIQTDSVIQIECKKLATSNKFRAVISDGSNNDFDALLNRFAGYVTRLYEKSIHIKQEIVPLPSKIVKEVFSVFVVLDDLYFIDSRFKKEITTRAVRKTAKIPEDFKYHILGCSEFEVLCEFLKTHPDKNLVDLLRLKEEDQNYYMEFSCFLEKDFNSQCTKLSLIWDAYHKLWASIGLRHISEYRSENAL